MSYGPHVDEPPRPCWWCAHFGGVDSSRTAALCGRPGAPRVCAVPQRGCAFYAREPGADDELEWSPLRGPMVPLKGAPAGRPPVEWAP